MVAKGEGKTTVAVAHEKLPDARTGERLKVAWRGWLDAMKSGRRGRLTTTDGRPRHTSRDTQPPMSRSSSPTRPIASGVR